MSDMYLAVCARTLAFSSCLYTTVPDLSVIFQRSDDAPRSVGLQYWHICCRSVGQWSHNAQSEVKRFDFHHTIFRRLKFLAWLRGSASHPINDFFWNLRIYIRGRMADFVLITEFTRHNFNCVCLFAWLLLLCKLKHLIIFNFYAMHTFCSWGQINMFSRTVWTWKKSSQKLCEQFAEVSYHLRIWYD